MTSPYTPKDPLGILEGHTPGEPYHPKEEERALVSKFKLQFEEAHRYRLAQERQWELSRLYLKGEQLILRNRTTGEIFRLPQDDSHRLISVCNVLRPTARSLLGKCTRTVPTCIVIPPTADLADIDAAKVADSLLFFQRRRCRLDNVFIDWYRDITGSPGTGLIKLSWDREAGHQLAVCPECQGVGSEGSSPGDPCQPCQASLEMEYEQSTRMLQEQAQMVAGGLGQEVPQVEALPEPEIPILMPKREGDIRIEVIDCGEFYFDSSATDLAEAQWVCHRVAQPVAQVRQRWPKKARFIDHETGIYTDQHVTLLQRTATLRSGMRQLDDHVYLYEYHEKPTAEHPKGRIVWMANDLVLEEVESPYYEELGRFPFYIGRWEKNKGEFWGESWIEQAWTIQRELNILLTQMREQRELTNRPQVFVPHNAGLSVEEIDTTPGKIIMYNGVASRPPQVIPPPPFATYNYTEIDRMKGDMRAEASITDQEVGITSSEASGRYAAIIEAEASNQVGPILKYNHTEWIELHRGILSLCKLFYSPKRVWTINGADRPYSYAFEQINLNPGYDVDIQEDDSLSTNKAIRMQEALNLWNAGVLVNPETGVPDVKLFFRMAGIKATNFGPDATSADHAIGAAIPYMLEAGQPWQPKPWDNPEVMVEELTGWLKSAGRNKPAGLQAQVAQLWQFYMQHTRAALEQAKGNGVGAAPSGPQGQTAPKPESGDASQATPPQGGDSSTLPEADARVQQADQRAESASRTSLAHEG